MPKETPVERFRIWVDDVEPADVGPTIAALTKLGRGKVGFELVEDIRAFAKRTNPEIASQDFLAAWVAEHPTFRAIEAVNHFKANGRTGGSAYPALAVLLEKKILRKLGPGQYSRADIKHLASPKAKAPPRVFSKRAEDVILSYAKRNHGRANTAKLVEVFEKEGRAKNSVYASLDALMKEKQIKRVGDKGSGQYILLNKPAKAAKPPAKKPPPALTNGAAVAEVTNG